ncbi:MAG: hypothetical protein QJR04_20510 [Burkholderia multivorans]|nr:hypothetical protein [Burkholderia multivorans]MDI3303724.1 hypothetical protein [Burkholderia multivorans]
MNIAGQHARAFGDELLADRGADAAPCTGHECNLAVKPAHFTSPSCCSAIPVRASIPIADSLARARL